jgi:hypothetical protein
LLERVQQRELERVTLLVVAEHAHDLAAVHRHEARKV